MSAPLSPNEPAAPAARSLLGAWSALRSTRPPEKTPAADATDDGLFDEAVRTLEWRRFRRALATGRLPFLASAGTFLLAWLLVPLLFGGALPGDPRPGPPLSVHTGWTAGILLAGSGLAAALAGGMRAWHLWQEARSKQAIESWLLSRQNPARVAATCTAMAAVWGALLVAIPIGVGSGLALVGGGIGESGGALWLRPAVLLLLWLLLALSALAGASAGALVFFVGTGLVRTRWAVTGAALLAAVPLALWLRIERVERGIDPSPTQHVARAATAVLLATPAPAILGTAAPEWWQARVAPRLGVSLPARAGGLLYALWLAGATAGAAALAGAAYRRFATEPAWPAPSAARALAPVEAAGDDPEWRGLRNAVWTFELRTRLRRRDTAEVLFLAAVTVAAGGFLPLLFAAGELSDPLRAAAAAREVFFWLLLTLLALVALIAPGLTADSIVQERERGTLELLLATPLRPREILVGKWLGAACLLGLLVTPALPLFGLCYLFHGASARQVAAACLLVLTMLFVGAWIGVTQSAIHARAWTAKFWAYAVTALFAAVPGGPFWIAAALASPNAALRQSLENQFPAATVVALAWFFVLALFWGNAAEQLEHPDGAESGAARI